MMATKLMSHGPSHLLLLDALIEGGGGAGGLRSNAMRNRLVAKLIATNWPMTIKTQVCLIPRRKPVNVSYQVRFLSGKEKLPFCSNANPNAQAKKKIW